VTIARTIELGAIGPLALAARLLRPWLPDTVELGNLLLDASAILLGQSLLRDLWLLAAARRRAGAEASARRTALCLCAESTVGIAGIIASCALIGAGIYRPLAMGTWSWSLLSLLVMGLGFLIKDYVLEARPWRIRRDPDHLNLLVGWKS